MNIKKLLLTILLSVIIVAIIVGITLYIKYARITEMCNLIKNGQTEKALEQISQSTDVNEYTAPLWLRPFFLLFGTDIELPLVVACKEGNLKVITALVNKGADPNKFLEGNWSPIEATFISRAGNRLDIAEYLVESGSDVDLYGSGQSALFAELSTVMYNHDLTIAEQSQSLNCMLYLLKNGASPTDIKGNTIIHYLSCTDYIELLDVVFQDYSNLASSQNINGQTPLMWAVNSGNIRSVQYLIMQGVDLDVTDYSGKSAYDYAVNKGYDEIAKLLKACPEQGTVLREPG